MKRAWTTSGGIILDAGAVVLCEVCPCNGLPEDEESGTGTSTATIGTGTGTEQGTGTSTETGTGTGSDLTGTSTGTGQVGTGTAGTGTAGTGTGTFDTDYWYCLTPRYWYCVEDTIMTGTGTGTGTGNLSERQCMQLTAAEMADLIALGWTAHSGPHLTLAECEAACVAGTGTGTGTGMEIVYGTGTGTGTVSGCNWCDAGVSESLLLTIVSGCDAAPNRWELEYRASGLFGSGWYSALRLIDGVELGWFVPCINTAAGHIRVDQIHDGAATTGSSVVPTSCTPLSSGDINIPTVLPCNATTIVRVTEI